MHVPKEFSDYVTVIRSTCALRTVFLQFTRSPHVGNCAVRNSDELYSFLDKQNCLQPIHINSTWKFTALVCCAANTWPDAGARLLLGETTWRTKSKWMTKFLDDRSQHCTHKETHSDGQACNSVVCSILSLFVIRHCAANCSGWGTVTLGPCCVATSCLCTRQQDRQST